MDAFNVAIAFHFSSAQWFKFHKVFTNPAASIVPQRRHKVGVIMKSAFLLSIAFLTVAVSQIVVTQGPVEWPMAGGALNGNRNALTEHQVGVENVFSLQPKWVFTTDGDVSATPTVAGDAVYVTDWNGNLFAIRKDSGQLIWKHKVSDYDGVMGSFSRVSPAIHGDDLIIGDIES